MILITNLNAQELGTVFFNPTERQQLEQKTTPNENNSKPILSNQNQINNNHLQNVAESQNSASCIRYYQVKSILNYNQGRSARVLLELTGSVEATCPTIKELARIAKIKNGKYYLEGQKIEVGDVIKLK